MKKFLLILAVAAGAIGVATGLGARMIAKIDKSLDVRSLETRIQDNIRGLKERRTQVITQVFKLRTKAGQEESALARYKEERDRLDAACKRLAAKVKEPRVVAVKWGVHELNREQSVGLLTDWAKRVEELAKQIEAAEQKAESYKAAVAKLEHDNGGFSESIAKLEVKLNELLSAREVLTVQRQVSEILAAAEGRDVPGETAGLIAELQTENDRLRGEIAAYGYSGSTDRLIAPDDDLRERTSTDLLAKYGVNR
jgi:chromosome segregation ATPase